MMKKIEIKSNKQWRNFLSWYELTKKEQLEFDWMDELTQDESLFIRYKNWVYCLQDFMVIDRSVIHQFEGWQGYHSDSAFSGIVINISKDGEQYQIGTYFS